MTKIALPLFVLVMTVVLEPAAFAAPNLVTNGDFEAGNTGFTSDYGFSAGGNCCEGQYTIGTRPSNFNGFFINPGDHTTGAGNMYIGNGSPTDGAIVWASGPITVAQNTNYFFEAFVHNLCCSSPLPGNTPAVLEFSVQGSSVESLGTAFTTLDNANWQGLSRSWFSASNTSVTLSLINRNTGRLGNDFALDDVYLGTISTVVPEPGTWVLFSLGLAGLAALTRRRAKQAA